MSEVFELMNERVVVAYETADRPEQQVTETQVAEALTMYFEGDSGHEDGFLSDRFLYLTALLFDALEEKQFEENHEEDLVAVQGLACSLDHFDPATVRGIGAATLELIDLSEYLGLEDDCVGSVTSKVKEMAATVEDLKSQLSKAESVNRGLNDLVKDLKVTVGEQQMLMKVMRERIDLQDQVLNEKNSRLTEKTYHPAQRYPPSAGILKTWSHSDSLPAVEKYPGCYTRGDSGPSPFKAPASGGDVSDPVFGVLREVRKAA